jgi:Ca-activated chloride channel homolog
MILRIDYLAFGLAAAVLAGFIILLIKKNREIPPHFLYSRLDNFSEKTKGPHIRYQSYEKALFLLSILFLLAAFLDPRMMSSLGGEKAEPLYTEGRLVYFILDVSGSMRAHVVDLREGKEEAFPTRLELLKEMTAEFIQMRPQDLIGLVSFARASWVLSPPTLDRGILKRELEKLDVVPDRDYDGTAIGYAIYKTASLIGAARSFSEKDESYDIEGAAMILVTDGFHSPHPEDAGKRLRTMGIEDAAAFAKEQQAHLYIVNIDPLIHEEEFAPQRRLMERAAEATGGKFFAAEDSIQLEEIYRAIDELEESIVPEPPVFFVRRLSFYPFLILLGLIALSGAMILETLIIKKVP